MTINDIIAAICLFFNFDYIAYGFSNFCNWHGNFNNFKID